MFKYPNPIPTNTEIFYDKTPHLTDYGNYQVGDSIGIVGSGPMTLKKWAHIVLPCDGWVPLALCDDGGSLGPVCRVSSLGSSGCDVWISHM
ncbi:hypothetical protein DVH24_000127 [Malus domestica]|uniref:Uncharacterized protein n=1 Tax=Malus domestica TaxID=3750 RepID=A0A498IZ43_MALDO|nr:hypothetical protein DVH24_000127 [Malus domestica]